MLSAAFENAKIIEQKLVLYTDGNFSALQKRNIDISTLSIFIDLLIEEGIQIEKILPLNVLTQHWLRLNNKENFNLTLQLLKKNFPNLKTTLCVFDQPQFAHWFLSENLLN